MGRGERLCVQFFVETGNDSLEFYFFVWLDLRKLDSECPRLHPSDLSFIDPQRPIKPGNIDAAFKCSPRDNRLICFDHTAAGGEIQRPALAFPLLT